MPCLARTREALGDAAFGRVFDEGATMRFDEARLARREDEIAGLVADGLTNREIAEHLVLSQRTAEGHVGHILGKLGFTSRAHLAA